VKVMPKRLAPADGTNIGGSPNMEGSASGI
jgi:hypothetical protein